MIKTQNTIMRDVMERMLLKPPEVAKILSIGRSMVYELIAQKEIPSIRIGRCIRVPSEALQRWLKEKEEKENKA